MESWVSGLNHRPAKATVRKGSRVQIPPVPPYFGPLAQLVRASGS